MPTATGKFAEVGGMAGGKLVGERGAVSYNNALGNGNSA